MRNRPDDAIEFVRINGEAIRVTSWTPLDETSFRLVAIVRGSGDARSLDDLLTNPTVEVQLPDQPARAMRIANIDRRSTGEPPAIVTRFAVDFRIEDGEMPVSPQLSLEERVARLEQDLARLRQIVESPASD